MKKRIIILIVIVAVAGITWYAYRNFHQNQEMLHPKFYSTNGRLEATEIYVTSKLPGRIEKIFVKEGALVKKGDKLVQMQTDTLEAQKAVILAKIKVLKLELEMAQTMVKLKESTLTGAEKELKTQEALFRTGSATLSPYNAAKTSFYNAKAELEYTKINVLAAMGRLEEQKAELQCIEAELADSSLAAFYDGRIQYMLAHEGEVLAAGGRVMNLINLADSYVTFFLPAAIAGRVQIGTEVRLIFDAAPQYTINAHVTYIGPETPFTPQSAETQLDRDTFMFRIKASLNAEELQKYIPDVKIGIPGVVWVKLDPKAGDNQATTMLPQKAFINSKNSQQKIRN